MDVTGTLRSGDTMLTITDSVANYGYIPPGGVMGNEADRFVVCADDSIPPGTVVPCTLLVHSSNWEHDWTIVFRIMVGTPPDPPGTIVWGPKVCPSMPGVNGLYGLALNKSDNFLYCCHYLVPALYVYSSDSLLNYVGAITIPEDSCTDVSYCDYDTTFWLLCSPSRTAYKIKPDGTVIRSFPVDSADYPVGISENTTEHLVYVSDRRLAGDPEQRIFVYDTLGNLQSTIIHPKASKYGSRCLAMDLGAPRDPPSLLNIFNYFNAAGTAAESTVIYELDRVTGGIIRSCMFPERKWNIRGIEYDPTDGSYWVTIFQVSGGVPNQIFKVAGFNGPPAGVAEPELPLVNKQGPVLSVRPNPFNRLTSITLGPGLTGRSASLAVYDNNGRLVRTLAVSRQPSAVNSVVWDGRDQAGKLVSPGVYFFTASGTKAWGKVILTR